MFGKLKDIGPALEIAQAIFKDPNSLKAQTPLVNNAIGRLTHSYKNHMAMQHSISPDRCVVMTDWRNGAFCIIPVIVESDGVTMRTIGGYTLQSLVDQCDMKGLMAVIGQLSDPHAPELTWQQITQMLGAANVDAIQGQTVEPPQPQTLEEFLDEEENDGPLTIMPDGTEVYENGTPLETPAGLSEILVNQQAEWETILKTLSTEFEAGDYSTLVKLIANHVLRTDIAQEIVNDFERDPEYWTYANYEKLVHETWHQDQTRMNWYTTMATFYADQLDGSKTAE